MFSYFSHGDEYFSIIFDLLGYKKSLKNNEEINLIQAIKN